jgi:hypothetical protein
MPETLPIADAMEEAAAVLDAEQPVDAVEEEASDAAGPCWCGLTHAPGVTHEQPPEDDPRPVEASAPEQVPLFPPPPAPPFDFEKAYDELARLDVRARNKKGMWESCKRATKDAREEYDEALEDLHTAFMKVDTQRRNALRQQQAMQPVLVPVADAAPETESADGETKPPEDETTKGGDAPMGEPEEIETPEPEDETPTPEGDAPQD